MKRAFECGRNFQLTGENNFQELIEELNQALPQADVISSVCECKVCGKPFGDRLSLYEHYDEEHNKQTDL